VLRGAQGDEDPEDRAALVLRLEGAADVAEGACLAPEHVPEGACEHAVQVARMGGQQIPQGGQIRNVFDRVQRGTPFRVG
jgi:hypothetical protein